MPGNPVAPFYSIPKDIKGSITCAAIATDATTTVNLTACAVLDKVTGLAVAKTGSGSSTWGYQLCAVSSGGGTTIACAEVTVGSQGATLSSTVYNTLTWYPVEGAREYQIWRSSVGTSPSTQGLIATVGSDCLSFNDTGLVLNGPAIAAVPAADTSYSGRENLVNHVAVYNTGSYDIMVHFPHGSSATIAAAVANAHLTASPSDATFTKRLVCKTGQYRTYDFSKGRQWICMRAVGTASSCEIEVA